MIRLEQKEFEKIVAWAIDAIPEKYGKLMNNVAFVVEDEPTPEQRQKLHLSGGQTLFGLYEGVTRPHRSGSYSLALPDKITVFKNPLEASSNSVEELKERVRHTVWHEVAHHFGLGHNQIHKLDGSV